MNRLTLSASILAADFTCLAEELRKCQAAKVDSVHIDIMDGHFVPNLSMGPFIVEAVKRVTDLPLDVHLMIEQPEKLITAFADAGADRLTLHQEATPHLHRAVQLCRGCGVQAGLALNPATSLETLEWMLPEIDLLLLMTVNPGFGGQSLIPFTVQKVAEARRMLDKQNPEAVLQVDGGVNLQTAKALIQAGATELVCGSGFFASSDPSGLVEQLKAMSL